MRGGVLCVSRADGHAVTCHERAQSWSDRAGPEGATRIPLASLACFPPFRLQTAVTLLSLHYSYRVKYKVKFDVKY